MALRNQFADAAGLENFSARGDGSSRLEALSDGVFSLAIAILLLSSSVPTNFEELWAFVIDIIPFGICMLFIYWIWSQHVAFFLRYGILTKQVTALNTVLLFFVLCYVYPLKFLMTWLIKFFYSSVTGSLQSDVVELQRMIPFEKIPILMIIYSTGFVCIYLVLYLFYKIALGQKGSLKLTPLEEYETRFSRDDKLYLVGIGLLSILLAVGSLIFRSPWGSIISGWIYNLIWVIGIFRGNRRIKKIAELEDIKKQPG